MEQRLTLEEQQEYKGQAAISWNRLRCVVWLHLRQETLVSVLVREFKEWMGAVGFF